MRTARENYRFVMAKAMAEVDASAWDRYLEHTDAAMAALRAEGLVIVAAADVTDFLSWAEAVRDQIADGYCGYIDTRAVEAVNRLEAALAAGGE